MLADMWGISFRTRQIDESCQLSFILSIFSFPLVSSSLQTTINYHHPALKLSTGEELTPIMLRHASIFSISARQAVQLCLRISDSLRVWLTTDQTDQNVGLWWARQAAHWVPPIAGATSSSVGAQTNTFSIVCVRLSVCVNVTQSKSPILQLYRAF